jgi:hypothetical protein
LYRVEERYAEAEPQYQRVLELSEKVLGAKHPDTLTTHLNQVGLFAARGEPSRAVDALRRVEGQLFSWIGREFLGTESARVRRQLLGSRTELQSLVLTLAAQYPSEATATLAADVMVRWKQVEGEVAFDDYGRPEARPGPGPRAVAADLGDRLAFNPLPASREEVQRLAVLYKKARRAPAEVWGGTEAREGRLKRLSSAPKVLHLATHGFYLEGISAERPLLLGGLALAGANRGLKGELGPDRRTASSTGLRRPASISRAPSWWYCRHARPVGDRRAAVPPSAHGGVGSELSDDGARGIRRVEPALVRARRLLDFWFPDGLNSLG